MAGLNNIETLYELEITPEKLRQILASLETQEKIALEGQTVRYKFNHRFAFIYRPERKSTVESIEYFDDALAARAVVEKDMNSNSILSQ